MAPLFPVLEYPAAKREDAAAVDDFIESDDSFRQGGERHDDLENGAGRVLTTNRAVLERLERVIRQIAPVFPQDSAREKVGIDLRVADQGQDGAAGWVEGDDASFIFLK